jgi:hypothetical protein
LDLVELASDDDPGFPRGTTTRRSSMALFGRDYDYDSRYRSDRGERSHWGRSGQPIRANYERDYRAGAWGPGYEGGWRSGPTSGSDYRYAGYDRGYKSRYQTDHGDPFGDRQQQTPMRVIRGEARDYDRGYRGYDQGTYGPTWTGERSPGYRSGQGRSNLNQRTYRTYGRQYDDGWF